jgi:hypothetical protein
VPTIRTFAVKHNGAPITKTAALNAAVGDEIEVEFWVEQWSPLGQKLRAFNITLDSAKLGADTGAECGGLIPIGIDNPADLCFCENDAACAAPPPQCDNAAATKCFLQGQFCAGPLHNPDTGARLLVVHCELVGGLPVNTYALCCTCGCGDAPCDTSAVDTSSADYRWIGVLNDEANAKVYSVPKYVGTLIVKVMPGSDGVFQVVPKARVFDGGTVITFLTDEFGCHIPGQQCSNNPPVLVPLNVTVDGECLLPEPCALGPIVPTANCFIDARQPSAPDGTLLATLNLMDIEFDGAPDSLTEANFSIREVPAPVPPATSNGVFRVTQRDGDVVRVQFTRRATLGAWTCVSYLGASCPDEFCFAPLPADVSNDRTSAPGDILHLIDCLNGVRVCQIHQCDIDRSNVCGPPDILRTIDLLNGASTFDPWLNRNIPVCPSGP